MLRQLTDENVRIVDQNKALHDTLLSYESRTKELEKQLRTAERRLKRERQ